MNDLACKEKSTFLHKGMVGSERSWTLLHAETREKPGWQVPCGSSLPFIPAPAATSPVGAHGFASACAPRVHLVNCAHTASDVPVMGAPGPSTSQGPIPEVCDPGDEGVGPFFFLSLLGEEGQQHLTSRTQLLLPVWVGVAGGYPAAPAPRPPSQRGSVQSQALSLQRHADRL